MKTITRRDSVKGLAGLAALSQGARHVGGAQEGAIPPQGIGQHFRHVSYSDIGGRPDSVQVMLNRKHLYVGHMFSNGVTILDAADPRKLKPVGFSRAETLRGRITCRFQTICCCWPMGRISWPCSPTTTSAGTSRMRWPIVLPTVRNSARG